jgi:predicted dithiol-disulfide oxidoreductase (DUF899 family)
MPGQARSREGEIVRHLPTEPLAISALPPVTSRDEYEAARAKLLVKEKAHSREGDAIAAERRRLPMIEIPESVTVVGAKGEVRFLDVFEGRRMLVGYFHMWHDGQPREGQCIGCTYFASQVQRPLAHLHARDVTLAYLCEGSYEESRPYADFMGYTAPWYSARDAGAGLLADRGFGWLGCYVRDDHNRVYETYWTTDRGNEAGFWSYGLLDRTVFGRQEPWEDSPDGWPQIPAGQHQWRADGRPLAQWDVTDEPVAEG